MKDKENTSSLTREQAISIDKTTKGRVLHIRMNADDLGLLEKEARKLDIPVTVMAKVLINHSLSIRRKARKRETK